MLGGSDPQGPGSGDTCSKLVPEMGRGVCLSVYECVCACAHMCESVSVLGRAVDPGTQCFRGEEAER